MYFGNYFGVGTGGGGVIIPPIPDNIHSAEAKLRALAMQDSTMQSYFAEVKGSGILFRWFDRQLPPGYINRGTCVRVMRLATLRYYTKETAAARSVNEQTQPRFQIDVLDTDPERGRSAAAAILDWLGTVDLSSDVQFASPPTSPSKHPYVCLNQRAGMEPNSDPPTYVESLDIRIFNIEE